MEHYVDRPNNCNAIPKVFKIRHSVKVNERFPLPTLCLAHFVPLTTKLFFVMEGENEDKLKKQKKKKTQSQGPTL